MTFKEYRKKKELTQPGAAKLLGLHWKTIQTIEYGTPVSRRTAKAVEKWTKGAVKAAGLMGV
jgi:DNA-binding XRE family transcriptional regulator